VPGSGCRTMAGLNGPNWRRTIDGRTELAAAQITVPCASTMRK
jgi:hypothetical protein